MGGKWGWLDFHTYLTDQQTPQGKLPPQTDTSHCTLEKHQVSVHQSPPLWGQLTSPPEERTAPPVSDRRSRCLFISQAPLTAEQWAHSKTAEHSRYHTVQITWMLKAPLLWEPCFYRNTIKGPLSSSHRVNLTPQVSLAGIYALQVFTHMIPHAEPWKSNSQYVCLSKSSHQAQASFLGR